MLAPRRSSQPMDRMLSPASPALQTDSLPTEPPGKPQFIASEMIKFLIFNYHMLTTLSYLILLTNQETFQIILVLLYVLSF